MMFTAYSDYATKVIVQAVLAQFENQGKSLRISSYILNDGLKSQIPQGNQTSGLHLLSWASNLTLPRVVIAS